jgi:hypothetical protein
MLFSMGAGLSLTNSTPPKPAAPRDLTDADDSRVLEVVRYVDSLQERGVADGLLAPVRDRLRRLRPARTWRFPRLLLSPLDIVLVANDVWREGSARLPRAIIAPVAESVRQALPIQTAAAERIVARQSHPVHARVAAAGALVWPLARGALRAHGDVPPSWIKTGLPMAAYRPLTCAVASGLDAACRIAALSNPMVPPEAVEAGVAVTLQQAKAAGPVPWGVVLALTLQHFPLAAATRAAINRHNDPVWDEACDSAVAACWTWLEAGTTASGIGASAAFAVDLRRRVALLDAFGEDGARHRRALAARAKLRVTCLRQMEAGALELIVAPLRCVTEAGAMDERFLEILEAGAWALRQFGAAAGGLGDGASHGAALREARNALLGCAALAKADRLHLGDVLGGGE